MKIIEINIDSCKEEESCLNLEVAGALAAAMAESGKEPELCILDRQEAGYLLHPDFENILFAYLIKMTVYENCKWGEFCKEKIWEYIDKQSQECDRKLYTKLYYLHRNRTVKTDIDGE